VLYVGPPGIDDAIKLVHHFGSKFSLTNESIQHITEKINHMFQQKSVLPASSLETSLSGADIENLCREEAMKWIKHKIQSVSSVTT
jgi:SpoVK/Ycf46/Vps4 family AAA+-type ATPase